MKTLFCLVALALSPIVHAAEYPFSSEQYSQVRSFYSAQKGLREKIESEPCLQAALVSVMDAISGQSNLALPRVAKAKYLPRLGSVSVTFGNASDKHWLIGVRQESSDSCSATASHLVDDDDVSGGGGVSVHN